jgi:hypothetical protein
MYGSNIGVLAVDVLAQGNWIDNVWTLSGQQQTTNSSAYANANVDLTSYSVEKIRFRAIAAGSYRGDISIDNVEIRSEPTGPVAPIFIDSPFSKPTAVQDQSYQESVFSDASDANGDVLVFSKVSGPAWLSISSNGDLSGVPSVSDVGLNNFELQVSDGSLSSTGIVNINVSDGSEPVVLLSDDFESGLGNWSNVSGVDNENWTLDSNGTPSSGTGPTGGALNSSFYTYLETSSSGANASGDVAILESSAFSGSGIQFSFSYHMYGSDIGALAVDVLDNGSWVADVWKLNGQQQSSNSQAYTKVELDLSMYQASKLRLRAVAIGGYRGDIAIDDLEVLGTNIVFDDDDSDGIANASDLCPNTPNGESVNADGCSASQRDSDNDGYVDANDAFPFDAAEWLDTDSDGIGNNADVDDDGDGVNDVNDAFPLNPNEALDTDGDGLGNNTDADDDGDGVNDVNDAFPLNPNESLDNDSDGIGNNADVDDDGDGVNDVNDAFPLNPNEALDTDSDGIGNNADADDDGDGVADINDAFPLNPNEVLDSDSDGVGNNADPDDDNDGVADTLDAFPLDPNEALDSDGDGVGDNADAFPFDSTETIDTDLDGIGNNADPDDDNDGVEDALDAFPLDPSRTSDLRVRGTLTGLNSAISLSLNGAEPLTTDVNGSFEFSTILQDGDQYNVSIDALPSGQGCSIDNAIGVVNASDITNVDIDCYQASYALTPIVDGDIVDQPVDGSFDSISSTGLTISPKSFGGATPYNQRAVMEFDLSQLPAGVKLESALLQMTAFSGTSDNKFFMHGYEGNGVLEIADANASNTLADIQIRSSKPSSVTFDVTEYVNSLLSRGVIYLGLGLRGEESSNNAYLDFGASEYAPGAPTLTITLSSSGEPSEAHNWRRIEVAADGSATDQPIDGTFDTLNTSAGTLYTEYTWVNYLSRYILNRSLLEFNTASLSSLGTAITYSRLHFDVTKRSGGSTTEVDLYGYDGDGTVTITDADTAASYIDSVSLSSVGRLSYDITSHLQQLQLNATPYAGFQIRAASEGNTSSTDDEVGVVSSEGESAIFSAPYIEIKY